jgi:RNA polymerase primary sigma factor
MKIRAALRSTHTTGLSTYLQDLDGTALLSEQEERELAERIEQGDPEARDLLIRANLRLVVHLARGYLGRGLSLEDLIAEGNLGLMRAVEGFDGQAGVRFSTYAAFWVKQSIRGALMKHGKPIRLPHYMVTLLSKWKRAEAELAERLGRGPTSEEVGRALRLSGKRQAMALQAFEVLRSTGRPDAQDEDEVSPLARVVDERSKAIEDHFFEAEDMQRITTALSRLSEREATVLRMRFGLESGTPMTMADVGRAIRLTRERVRQIEKEAIEQLLAELDESGQAG